jgi:two-component system chemotaxis sensor kinase CheA
MSIDMQQFHAVFLSEAQDHISALESLFIAYHTDSYDEQSIHQIFRAAHSIKGSASIFGFTQLSDITHLLENIFAHVRHTKQLLSREQVDVCLDCVDTLSSVLESYQQLATSARLDETPPNSAQTAQTCQALTALLTQLQQNIESADFGFFDEHTACEDDTFGFFDDDTAQAKPHSHDALASSTNDAHKSSNTHTSASPSSLNNASVASSIRIDTDKIDHLVNLMGELVIADAMLQQAHSYAHQKEQRHSSNIQAALTNVTHNIRLMQDAVMGMRMLPMTFIFNRFPRIVRDLAKQLDKSVHLNIMGGETEIDKGMIEQLVDPLTHLIRNALDHGIETADERAVLNKAATAQILLHAEQRGGFIFIKITDDGRGLDRESILAKAQTQGLIQQQHYSDEEVWQLITAPGFSTKSNVTELSGRGVGMDVVMQNIKHLNGQLHIASTPGKGATFTIRLPLTMAIVDGMKIMCAQQLYVLPMNLIIESFRPTLAQVKTITNDRLIKIRDAYYPLLSLHDIFHPGCEKPAPQDAIVIMIAAGNERFCLHVDSLEGQQQVVIKNLEKNYKAVAGLAGATIMGDGNVAFILDVEQLATHAKQQEGELTCRNT